MFFLGLLQGLIAVLFPEKGRLIGALRHSDRKIVGQALSDLRRRGWLTDGSLNGISLYGADLHGFDLRNIQLMGADLTGVNFWDADLRGANLAGAILKGADLEVANMHLADLRATDLNGAMLYGAIMPDGKKWNPDVNLPYFTDPRSLYYGEAPYTSPINIARQFRHR